MRRVSQSRSLLALAVAAAMSLALVIPVAADLYLSPGQAAQVAYTNGDGVNVRQSPGFSGAIITTLREGAAVTILDGPVYLDDGTAWFHVSSPAGDGWVIHDYLASGPGGGGEAVTTSSWNASVVNTSGYGLRLRDGASLDAGIMTVMPEGASVGILATDIWDTDGMSWSQISYSGMTGYAATSYLSIGGGAPAVAPVTDTSGGSGSSGDSGSWHLTVGDRAAVSGTGGGGLNLRSGVGFGHGIITIVGEGNVVTIIDGPYGDDSGNGWYQVDYSSTIGWVHGGYLSWTDSAPTNSPGLGSADVPVEAPSGGGEDSQVSEPEPVAPVSGIGNAIVAEALNYVGTPYVWGGTTPSGWDCSGFTYYIVNKVTGNGMSRSLEVQAVTGFYVGSDHLAAGDLVFFQNTYKWGLSHVGIYIGGSQFVHASSERTGTIISDLWDSYWGPRYYTARRVATD